VTTNILDVSKRMKNQLITRKHAMFIPFAKRHVPSYSCWPCLMTFNLTQLLYLAHSDIVYCIVQCLPCR